MITPKAGALALLLTVSSANTASGFSAPIFHQQARMQRTAPSKTEGVEIELPDFEELFGRIQKVSPLARLVIQGGASGIGKGFAAIDDNWPSDMKWKSVEKNKRNNVFQIDKIDNFQDLRCPLFRFRCSLDGPCNGEKFAEFIMSLEERKKWDAQIEDVQQRYVIYDTEAANLAMGVGKYGDCGRLGVGYCQTKSNFAVEGREQLTLCGMQDFPDGSSLVWGTEMEEWNNHLMPEGRRLTRAKSHLFSTTLVPTGPDSFDVEYILQLETGGNIPAWITNPILVDTVKNMFKHAKEVYQDREALAPYLKRKDLTTEVMAERNSILMTP